MISEQHVQQLQKYLSTLPIDVVYLFGSQINGKATNLSDVDIAVLFKEDLNKSIRYDLKLKITSKACGIFKKEQVDVVDLQEAPIALRYSAVYPKKVIISINRERMIDFENSTVKMYLDFQPYLYRIAKRQIELTAKKGFNL